MKKHVHLSLALALASITHVEASQVIIEAEGSYSVIVADPPCNLSALSLGAVCNDGTVDVVYIGSYSGSRLYTTTQGPPASSFSGAPILTDAVSQVDGMGNTNKLLARNDTSYPMAQSCRALGAKWYLPSIEELRVLFFNKAAVTTTANLNPYQYVDVYYSSTDLNTEIGYHLNMVNGAVYTYSHPKYPPWTFRYRCFRRD